MAPARDVKNRLVFFYAIGIRLFAFFTIWPAMLVADAQTTYQLKKVDLPAPFKYTEVRNITRDRDGYIWFTTSQGIWRFDGTDVEPFRAAGLPQSSVPDFIYRYNNFLLLAFDSPHDSRLFAYDILSKKLNSYIIDDHCGAAYTAADGSLMFCSLLGQLWRFSSNGKLSKAQNVRDIPGWVPPARFEHIFRDVGGTTYLFYSGKVARFKEGKIVINSQPPDTVSNKFHFNYVMKAYATPRYILAKYSDGFIIYDKLTLKKIYTDYDQHDVLINAGDRGFVILTPPGSMLKPVAPLFSTQTLDLSAMGIIKSFTDDPTTGGTLISTTNGIYGLAAGYINDNQKAVPDFFHDQSIRSIYRLKNGKMYVGSYKGFFAVNNDQISLVAPLVIYCMYPVDNETLLLGIEGGKGFATLDTRTDKLTLFNNASRYMYGFCLAKDDGGFAGGTTRELFRLTPAANGQWAMNILLSCDTLGNTKQALSINKQWWIASANGLYKLSPGQSLQKVFPHNEKYAVYAVLPDGDNFWLGTGGHGLTKIDKKGNVLQQVKFSDGLNGDFVYSLCKVNGLLFAGTNEGLSVFDMTAGMQSIDAPDDPQYSEELNHSAMFYDEYRHQLILGGVHGLLFPNMDYYSGAQEKKADQVRLSYIKRDSSGGQQPDIDLFAGMQNNLQLDPGYTFMGLKFSGSNIWRQRSFLFRILELDSAWRKSNLNTEISFYGLSPGKYTLEARFPSVTNRRYWFIKTIIVVPHFYQSWFFKLIMALLIALAIYAAWLYRISKIRSEHLLRTTIASDLHDEIGSALTRISLTSELMNIKRQLDTNVVERISSDSKEAIASISDIIWSIDARNDTRDDLVARMREHAHNMLDNMASVNFEVLGLDKVTNLPQLVRQNIYLIFKEAINNIAKHNTNPEVWITLNNQLMVMTITIRNTVTDKKQASTHTGQGLRNMQMRAKRMKAAIDILREDNMFAITIKMKRW